MPVRKSLHVRNTAHGGNVPEILGLIARGMTNPEIATQLFLSNHTVKTHISRIFAKSGSPDRAAAIGSPHRRGIG